MKGHVLTRGQPNTFVKLQVMLEVSPYVQIVESDPRVGNSSHSGELRCGYEIHEVCQHFVTATIRLFRTPHSHEGDHQVYRCCCSPLICAKLSSLRGADLCRGWRDPGWKKSLTHVFPHLSHDSLTKYHGFLLSASLQYLVGWNKNIPPSVSPALLRSLRATIDKQRVGKEVEIPHPVKQFLQEFHFVCTLCVCFGHP